MLKFTSLQTNDYKLITVHMFTGIIQKQAKIKEIKKYNDILSIGIAFLDNKNIPKLKLGDSISVNGICSTVVECKKDFLKFEYMKETVSKTTVSEWALGDLLNIETSLKVGDSLDGHFVYGHIDSVGEIKSIKSAGGSSVFEINISKKFQKNIVYKGSVAIDGISLTVSDKTKVGFTVSLIPYTMLYTNLNKKVVGDMVNVELDVLGKYVIGSQK
jgi:riboflavin synthase